MIISTILVGVRCNISQPWIFVGEKCGDLVRRLPWVSKLHAFRGRILTHTQFQRWQVVTAFDVITEACLFGLALYMLQGLKLKLEKKLVVLTAFALRLP